MKKHVKLLLIIVFLLIIITSIILSYFFIFKKEQPKKRVEGIEVLLEGLDLDGVDNLMIVAHPDDDTIWGGGHLIEDNYLVVCITCGNVEKRVKEFKSVMNSTNDEYLMLYYPDLTDGKRDDWSTVYNKIEYDIEEIINYKDWNMIVTHNPEGEYGHQHHKMTSSIVTDKVLKNNLEDKLYYFGKYYTKNEKENLNYTIPEIDKELLERKKEILKQYASQEKVIESLSHMLPNENFVSYQNWS